MPDPTTTRWRLLRGTVFAVLAGQLAALGHLLGGGALPDPAVLITVTVFLGGAVSSLARRRRTGPQILGMLVLSQVVFHAVFLLTAGHAVHPGRPEDSISVGAAQMVAFHLIAALATSWLLTSGEGTLFRLFGALRRVLAAGQRKGLGLRLHGNHTGPGPAVMIAVDTGAAAIDHCNHLTDTDITALTGSPTVATLLPAVDLHTGQPPAPGRHLIDAGVSIALASGADPGTSYTSSMNLVVALGVLRCGLTPAEAVHAATAGGARALRRTDVGTFTVGARADLHVLNAPSHAYLAYRPGMPLTHSVYQHGTRVT